MMETPSTPTDRPPPPPETPAAPAARRSDKVRLVLILGGIAALLGVVLFLVRDNQSAGDLAVGTCFDEPTAETDISTVTRQECTEAHDAEVFHVGEYTEGSDYPISLSLDRYLDATCVPAFAAYTGRDFDTSEDLTIGYFYPSRDGWDAGDRTITCYVVRTDEAKMTESVKAATDS